MHKDALKYCAERPFLKTLLHISFISPVFVLLMWVKPISRHYFTEMTWPGIPNTLMTPDSFDTTRLVLIIVVLAIRFFLMPHYLQSYLNLAPEKVRNLKKEAGRISNIELQKMVARVFYYLCVVTLQYLTPLMLCLFSTLMLKTLGDYKWSSYVLAPQSTEIVNTTVKASPLPISSDILESSQQFSLTLISLKKVFTPVLYRVASGALNGVDSNANNKKADFGEILYNTFDKVTAVFCRDPFPLIHEHAESMDADFGSLAPDFYEGPGAPYFREAWLKLGRAVNSGMEEFAHALQELLCYYEAFCPPKCDVTLPFDRSPISVIHTNAESMKSAAWLLTSRKDQEPFAWRRLGGVSERL
ncbi:Transmembrane protein 161B like protein [Argiope bruennichi]|uniref:Transmembrane protein 161B like protein n=1 Tax=Argiope bruennichi TaxID=94029 RepID=A0A8T0FCF7_ARGBR|nr:Transmembrane protein 161B like protein [Argiope bruennichi]